MTQALNRLRNADEAMKRSAGQQQSSEAARQAGYDPRGTGGFYTGNGCLRSDEDYRVLTKVGTDWFESEYPRYKEQLLDKFPDAPDIDLI